MTASEWFSGKNINAIRLSLKPDDMENLTNVTQTPPPTRASTNFSKFESITENTATLTFGSEAAKAKQDSLKKSLNDRVKMQFDELEQSTMEGVEEKEWEE